MSRGRYEFQVVNFSYSVLNMIGFDPYGTTDHNDVETDIYLKSGELLLYESAKLLHGRPGIRCFSCNVIDEIDFAVSFCRAYGR